MQWRALLLTTWPRLLEARRQKREPIGRLLLFARTHVIPPHTNSKYYSRNEYCVVREGSGGREEAKCQLERALERQYKLVIVEPQWQGDHAIR